MLVKIDDLDLGPILMHNVMWRMPSSPGEIRFRGRRLGADTNTILIDELNYSVEDVDAFRQKRVVA